MIKSIRIVDLSLKEQQEAVNEVTILSRLDCHFVVRYYDSFVSGRDSLNIVMEYCNKGDLKRIINKAKSKNQEGLYEDLIWHVALQIMLGLNYIHSRNILHRDLKSANIFLCKDGSSPYYKVKIGDLGVAKLLDTSTAFAQTIVGTP